MKMKPLSVAFLCLFLLVLTTTEVSSQSRSQSSSSSPRPCVPPQWPASLNISNPVAANEGKVVLVALMVGYCGYCVNQAASLERLKNRLSAEGLTDIEMVLINGGQHYSRMNINNLQDATDTLPVLQDTEDNVLFQQVFGGSKDDFIIYDRCGNRAVFVPHPYSYLGYTVTERVLRFVYSGNHNCYCARDASALRRKRSVRFGRTHGDQSMVQRETFQVRPRPGGILSGFECPRGDRICERYIHALNNGNLERSSSRRRSWSRQHSDRRGPSWQSIRDRNRDNTIEVGNTWYHRRRENGHVRWSRGGGHGNRHMGRNYGGAV